MPSFSLGVYCPMITTSLPPGSTINSIVNRTGPHGVSILKLSGHDCASISHCWPNDVTTRACPTNACVNAVYVIPGCPCRASTSFSDIAVRPEPLSIRILASAAPEAPETARRPSTCYVRASKCGSVPTVSTLVPPLLPGCKTETRAYEIVLESPHDCCDAGAGNGVNNWRCILWPSALRKLVLHRLEEPIIHSRHLLPWNANVLLVDIILPIWFKRSRFGLRNHRL